MSGKRTKPYSAMGKVISPSMMKSHLHPLRPFAPFSEEWIAVLNDQGVSTFLIWYFKSKRVESASLRLGKNVLYKKKHD